MARVGTEDLVSAHLAYGLGDAGAHKIKHLTAPDEVEQRDDHEPDEEGSAADYERILQSDYVSESEDGGAGIELYDELCLVGDNLSPMHHRCAQGICPSPEGGHYKVVDTADKSRCQKGFGAVSASFAADEDLGGGGCLRERVLSVHILHEILAERNEEEYAEESAQKRAEEHLPEIHLKSEYVDCRKCEYRTSDNYARAGTYALDNDVLGKSVLFAERAGDADRKYGDRYGRLKDLSDLEPEISRCCRKDYGHHEAHCHGIWGNFLRFAVRTQQWLIFLARIEFPVRVLRKA